MKRIAVLFIALITSATMFGQFHFGPQIGYSASNLNANFDDIEANLKSNFVFGAFARFGNKIYLQPEVNWMTTGSVFKYPSIDNYSPVEQEINMSQINIPVSLGWRIIDLNVVNIRLFGGIDANIITNSTINTTDEDNSIGDGLVDPLKETDIKDLVWQYHFGVGVDVLMFALDAKYVGPFGESIAGNIAVDGYNNDEPFNLSAGAGMFLVTLGWKIF